MGELSEKLGAGPSEIKNPALDLLALQIDDRLILEGDEVVVVGHRAERRAGAESLAVADQLHWVDPVFVGFLVSLTQPLAVGLDLAHLMIHPDTPVLHGFTLRVDQRQTIQTLDHARRRLVAVAAHQIRLVKTRLRQSQWHPLGDAVGSFFAVTGRQSRSAGDGQQRFVVHFHEFLFLAVAL